MKKKKRFFHYIEQNDQKWIVEVEICCEHYAKQSRNNSTKNRNKKTRHNKKMMFHFTNETIVKIFWYKVEKCLIIHTYFERHQRFRKQLCTISTTLHFFVKNYDQNQHSFWTICFKSKQKTFSFWIEKKKFNTITKNVRDI